MVSRDDIPTYAGLHLPALCAPEQFNGSATLRQITDEVVDKLDSGPELVFIEYPNRSRPILEDRIAWACSYCFLAGLARRLLGGLVPGAHTGHNAKSNQGTIATGSPIRLP